MYVDVIQAKLNPLFYIRLVGPAIIIGKVKRTSFRNFTIEFTPQRSRRFHYHNQMAVTFEEWHYHSAYFGYPGIDVRRHLLY